MSILNDKQIRALSLQPTHRWKGFPLSIIGDTVYFLESGEARPISSYDDIDSAVKIESPLKNRMIAPFEPEQIRSVNGEKVISYGTSSMGYDVRLGNKFKIFTNIFSALIDPLDMPENAYVDHEGDYVIIPPNSYILGHTVEYFCIPKDITAICIGKSTYARAGCAVNITPIEPGFEGEVVIEVANQTPLPMKVYARMGIAQFLFFRGEPCQVSYANRNGKYQGQTGIQTAIV